MWKIRLRRFRAGAKPPAAAPGSPAPVRAAGRDHAADDDGLSSWDRRGRRIIEFGLLGLLALTPLPIASVEAWSILGIELAALVLLAVYLSLGKKPRSSPKMVRDMRILRPVFIGLFAFLAFQMLPLPGMIVRLLSPRAAALRSEYVPVSASSGLSTLSLLPGATLGKTLELLAYVLIGFLVARTVTHRKQIRRIMITLVGVGIFEALYGMFELSRGRPSLLFYPKVHNLDSATGTFVNRNHYAGYLEMVIPLALGLIISRLDIFGEPGTPLRARFARFLDRGLGLNIVLGIGLVIMAVALFLSNSRSGFIVLLFSFGLMLVLTAQFFGHVRIHQRWVRRIIQVAAVTAVGFGLYVGLETMVGRFAVDRLLQEGRPRYWGAVMTMIGQFPLVGVGYGAFGGVYQAYDTTGMEYALVHAHNDYLELLAELGLAGFALLACAVGWILFKSFRTWMARRHPELKGLALGGLASVAAILTHSLTDFNLQIPANALVFSVVLALTMTTAYHRKT